MADAVAAMGAINGASNRIAEIISVIDEIAFQTNLLALGQIVDSVKKLTDVVHEISAASTEQASGIEQVGNAIAQLDRSTQENAALVEESAAAAETLSRQSAEMVQAAAVFKLADDGRSKSYTSGYDSGASPSQSWQESPAEHSSRIAA